MVKSLAKTAAITRTVQAVEPEKGIPVVEELFPAVPARLAFIFDERPLLPDEDAERYDQLRRTIMHDLLPRDAIEAIWTKDIIDLIWEVMRLRRWRSLILVQADLKAARDLIEPGLRNEDPMGLLSFEGPSSDSLAAGWKTGSADEKARVDQILEDRGLTEEDVRAYGFLTNLPSIDRIDRMIFAADQRRDSLLREIERKRASFAQRVRTAAAEVIDVVGTGA